MNKSQYASISNHVMNQWCKNNISLYDISFMRICSNSKKKFFAIEDERDMTNIIVEQDVQDNDRIVTIFFEDCNNEDYLHMKNSIETSKDVSPLDYEKMGDNYMFHLEISSEFDYYHGGDINVVKSKCYVDENNNSIVFIC